MCRIQMWLTATRAVSGLRGSVIHVASARRRPVLVARNEGAGSLPVEPRKWVAVGLGLRLLGLGQGVTGGLQVLAIARFAGRGRLRLLELRGSQ
jgi:hypothetical protein